MRGRDKQINQLHVLTTRVKESLFSSSPCPGVQNREPFEIKNSSMLNEQREELERLE